MLIRKLSLPNFLYSFSGINLDMHHILCSFADTSRHYLPIDVIKHVIESMSYAKLVRYVALLLLILKLEFIVTTHLIVIPFPASLILLAVILILRITISRMSCIGTSLMNSHFLWKYLRIQNCGKVHIQSGSATQLRMHMILSSKILYLI